MVSPLWQAAADGDLTKVNELLAEGPQVDIEIKDHTGDTPLIQAVKNGHVEIVKALLAAGADPLNASSQGKPEELTSDQTVLELLSNARAKSAPNGIHTPTQPVYGAPGSESYVPYDHTKGYPYPPINGHVPYPYPYVNGHDAQPPPGVHYYLPPPPPPPASGTPPADQSSQEGGNPSATPNLPPPDIARTIPCRFFPACRYGSSCIFMHPQTPYFPGAIPPPAQYPPPHPYDPMNPPPQMAYYAMPPPIPAAGAPSYPTPPAPGVMMSPVQGPHPGPSQAPPLVHPHPHPPHHARSNSEVPQPPFSPSQPVPPPFSPSSAQPPAPVPFSPTQPVAYMPFTHGAAPIPVLVPHPGGPQSPRAIATMYPLPPPAHITSPPPPPHADGAYPPPNGYAPPPMEAHPRNGNGHMRDNSGRDMGHSREGSSHFRDREGGFRERRGGSMRRGSFGSRKPPCLFFPSGRCRNGDACRFPHVLPDEASSGGRAAPNGTNGSGPQNGFSSSFNQRFPPRGRGSHGFTASNGTSTIEEKMGELSVDDANGATTNSSTPQRSPNPSSASLPHRYSQKGYYSGSPKRQNGPPPPKPQRVPNADDFPVLAGSVTPPHVNGHGHGPVNGLTAAQVLQGVKKNGTPRNASSPGAPKAVSENENTVEKTSTIAPAPNGISPYASPPDTAAKQVDVSA